MWSLARPALAARRCPLRARGRTALAVAALGLVLVVAPPASARRAPALSGTIVSGLLTTGVAMPCQSQVDCLPWLASGCSPALATKGTAWLTAIVDVRPLADGTTERPMVIRRGSPTGRILGGAHVQFWRADCTEARAASWHSTWDCGTSSSYRPSHRRTCERTWSPGPLGLNSVGTDLVVPPSVRWMTVSANDNLNISWSLG